MLFGILGALLLQQLPGMGSLEVPITEVHRDGKYLVGKATTLDGKPVQKVYLIHGKVRELAPGVTPYIVGFRVADIGQGFSITDPGDVLASAPVRNGRFRMDLHGVALPKADLIMGTLTGTDGSAYPIDFAAKVNAVPASWNGPDQLWLRVGIPLLGVVAVLGAWLMMGKRREVDPALSQE